MRNPESVDMAAWRLAKRVVTPLPVWILRCIGSLMKRVASARAAAIAEAELRALDTRELHDLGLDQGGIVYAARNGREVPRSPVGSRSP